MKRVFHFYSRFWCERMDGIGKGALVRANSLSALFLNLILISKIKYYPSRKLAYALSALILTLFTIPKRAPLPIIHYFECFLNHRIKHRYSQTPDLSIIVFHNTVKCLKNIAFRQTQFLTQTIFIVINPKHVWLWFVPLRPN